MRDGIGELTLAHKAIIAGVACLLAYITKNWYIAGAIMIVAAILYATYHYFKS